MSKPKPSIQSENIGKYIRELGIVVTKRDKHKGGEASNLVASPPVLEYEKVKKYITGLDFGKYNEITINPKPDYIQALEDDDIKGKIEKSMKNGIKAQNKYFSNKLEAPYSIQPEYYMIGEHGAIGTQKLHYHGIIRGMPNDYAERFYKYIRRYVGRTHVGYIQYEDSYKKYMFKAYDGDNKELWWNHSYILSKKDIE